MRQGYVNTIDYVEGHTNESEISDDDVELPPNIY